MLQRASSFHGNKAFLGLYSSSGAKALSSLFNSCMQSEACHFSTCFCCERSQGQAAGAVWCVHFLSVFACSLLCFALLLNR